MGDPGQDGVPASLSCSTAEDPASPAGESDLESGEEDLSEHPLHDAGADDEDAAWVAKHLHSSGCRRGESATKGEKDNEEGYRLSCPCCFSLLCLECQAHEEYEGQFRAVFVRNCRVVEEGRLKVQVRGEEKDDGVYKVVVCEECGSEVGVIDEEEVYHFCNVLF